MGCATATIKYLVFLFNALCALLGLGVIVVSSLALKDVIDETRPLIIFFIVIGSIVFLISFFGCCGAIKENVCLTWTYATLMLVLLILTCVLSFAYLNRIDEKAVSKNTLDKAWDKQKNGTDAMSIWQSSLHCCGVNGSSDYTSANLAIPASCYAGNGTANATATPPAKIYTEGCLSSLINAYAKSLKYVKLFAWILIGVEGAAFLFATILAITFNNEQRRSRY
ncbi:Tsp42Er [Drosophila busckii]|uniref:Tetraspanin n=1 Tax=Drosophila busckii TaxID=30019 RepID=A0A0M3QUU7_DROBS|nr:protein late bloomer [Drosophila busckii]ALC41253.1 Tsp42Er [Drosophila busckii]